MGFFLTSIIMARSKNHKEVTSVKLMALSIAIGVSILTSCSQPKATIDAATYAKEIEQWRVARLAELKSDNGWLTLVGLYWLKDGENKFGSDPAKEIVLPKSNASPAKGSFLVENGAVKFETSVDSGFTVDGKPVTSVELKSDADGSATVLRRGSMSFQIIARGDKLGLRVKDKENPDRLNFKGLDSFPADLKWRVEAHFEPYNPPKPMPIVNVLGMETGETSPGAVVFEVDGRTYRLDPITEKGEPKLFVIFADSTSGNETYGAGRYLYADPPDANGRMVIDFNKAYSPPCAFTNYATCPLPPSQNRLAFAIPAGEKYSGHPK